MARRGDLSGRRYHRPGEPVGDRAGPARLGGAGTMSTRILIGDVRDRLADLPDGSEPTLAGYIAALVEVFREVRRVLHPTGVCFVNIGDSYLNKQLLMVPAR